MILSEKQNSVCYAQLPHAGAGVTQNLGHAYSLPLKSKKAEILPTALIWAN
jgi:hypothetical protein